MVESSSTSGPGAAAHSGDAATPPLDSPPRHHGSSSLRPGLQFGDYVLEDRLGAGGAGEVWRASNIFTNVTVALKFCNDPLLRETFLNEAQTLAELQRASAEKDFPATIAKLLETHLSQDPPYLVIEYCEGGDVRRVLNAHGPLPQATVALWAGQLADGLRWAHDRNILHRDIKPENILLRAPYDPDARTPPTLKITDFGLGRVTAAAALSIHRSNMSGPRGQAGGGGAAAILEGTSSGTIEYMSPEQFEGRAVGPASDIYSLGVVIFELLTGRRPRGHVLPSRLEAGLDPAWDDLFERCYVFEPEKRFASVEEFGEFVERHLGAPRFATGPGGQSKSAFPGPDDAATSSTSCFGGVVEFLAGAIETVGNTLDSLFRGDEPPPAGGARRPSSSSAAPGRWSDEPGGRKPGGRPHGATLPPAGGRGGGPAAAAATASAAAMAAATDAADAADAETATIDMLRERASRRLRTADYMRIAPVEEESETHAFVVYDKDDNHLGQWTHQKGYHWPDKRPPARVKAAETFFKFGRNVALMFMILSFIPFTKALIKPIVFGASWSTLLGLFLIFVFAEMFLKDFIVGSSEGKRSRAVLHAFGNLQADVARVGESPTNSNYIQVSDHHGAPMGFVLKAGWREMPIYDLDGVQRGVMRREKGKLAELGAKVKRRRAVYLREHAEPVAHIGRMGSDPVVVIDKRSLAPAMRMLILGLALVGHLYDADEWGE